MPEPLDKLYRTLAPSTLLASAGGCVIWDRFPVAEWFVALRAEAEQQLSVADSQDCWRDDAEEIRGGMPSRKLLTAGGGPAQDTLYAEPMLHAALSQLCGARVVPSGSRGSYSFYARPGDYLGLHRDVDDCDVVIITALQDNAPAGVGATLVAYPGHHAEPLSVIRAQPHDGAKPVAIRPGQSAVLAGGLIPHCVTPTAPGQLRVISALCFQLN